MPVKYCTLIKLLEIFLLLLYAFFFTTTVLVYCMLSVGNAKDCNFYVGGW